MVVTVLPMPGPGQCSLASLEVVVSVEHRTGPAALEPVLETRHCIHGLRSVEHSSRRTVRAAIDQVPAKTLQYGRISIGIGFAGTGIDSQIQGVVHDFEPR